MPLQRIFPKPEDGIASYVGSMNMDIIDGKAVPAFDQGPAGAAHIDFAHYVVATIEAKAPNGTPRHYVLVNKSCYRYEDGAWTLDGTFTDVVQGGCIVDNGAGVAILLATFGDSATVNGHYWRDLTTDTSPWTINSGATVTTAFNIITVGSDVFAVTGTNGQGRTLLGEHKIAICAAGDDPRVALNFAAAEPIGTTSDWPVTNIISLRDSCVAARADGFYYRNDGSKEWEPIRSLMNKMPHGLTGKGMAPGENCVYLPTPDGQVFHYDGVNAHVVTPYHGEAIAKDALRGRISAIADRGDRVVMHEEPNHTYLPGPAAADAGVRFFTVIAGVGAEITAGVTDGSNVTPVSANMPAWGGSVNDRLICVSPFPLEAIVPVVATAAGANANACRFATPETKDGSGAFVSLGNVVDFTRLGLATMSLVTTGYPPASTEAILGWDPINAFDLAQLDSVTIPTVGVISGVFIYQWRPASAVAMSAGTTINEIGVIEARQGLPFAATKDYTHRDRGGLLSRLHVGQRVGAASFTWTTVYVLDTHGGVQGLAWTMARTGSLTNGGPGLLVIGRERQFLIAEGATRDPTRTPRARLTQWTTSEPGPLLAIRNVRFEDNGKLAIPDKPKVIKRYIVDGDYIKSEDVVRAVVEMDNNRTAYEFRAEGGSPIILKNARAGACRKADHFFALEDTTQRDPFPPQIREIWMEWDYAPGSQTKDPPFKTKAAA